MLTSHTYEIVPTISCPDAQLPANLLILRVGAPNLLAFIVCAWGIVGAATGMPLRKQDCMEIFDAVAQVCM